MIKRCRENGAANSLRSQKLSDKQYFERKSSSSLALDLKNPQLSFRHEKTTQHISFERMCSCKEALTEKFIQTEIRKFA